MVNGLWSGEEEHHWSVLLWIPSMKSICSALFLGDLFLNQLILQVGKLRLSVGPRPEPESPNFWLILNPMQICLEATKPEACHRATELCLQSVCKGRVYIALYCGGKRLIEQGRGSTCCKDVVGGRWQDAVIWVQDLVFEVGIIMPAGLPS